MHTHRNIRRHTRLQHAFTLLEMVVVIAIIAILSASAIPALNSLQGARQAAAAQEVERMLLTARAQAMATGRPWGVEFDFPGQRARFVSISAVGSTPAPAISPGKGVADWLDVQTQYPGSAISNLTLSNGLSNASGTIWFDTTGNPAVRQSDGTRTADATADAQVAFAGGVQVSVRRLTGAVER